MKDKVLLEKFWVDREPLLESQLGLYEYDKREFYNFHDKDKEYSFFDIVEFYKHSSHISFFCVKNMQWYMFDFTEEPLVIFKELKHEKDFSIPALDWTNEDDDYAEYTFKEEYSSVKEMFDNVEILGCSLEEILSNSIIFNFH